MLPELNNKRQYETFAGSLKSQIAAEPLQRPIQNRDHKSASAKKVRYQYVWCRTGGGFIKKTGPEEVVVTYSATYNTVQQQNLKKFALIRNAGDLASEIKLIEKKIKACQRKIEQDKKEQQRRGNCLIR